MNSTKTMVIIGSVVLVLIVGGVGGWMTMTAPPDNLEPWKEAKCNEYVSQLEMVNKYKMFWSSIQKRVAFNDCLRKIDEAGGKPDAGKP